MQISEGLRIKHPRWHPDHSTAKIDAVINQAGTNNLVLFAIDKFLPENSFSQSNLDQISTRLSMPTKMTSLSSSACVRKDAGSNILPCPSSGHSTAPEIKYR